MESAQPLLHTRHPLVHECNSLAAFFNAHGLLGLPMTPLHLSHHLAGTWLCEDGQGQVLAAATSWSSPTAYSTAVVDNLAMAEEAPPETLALLLDTLAAHWSSQCARRLMMSTLPAGATQHAILKQAERICLHNKKMRPIMNTANGEVSEDTLFEYFQDGNLVWGTYSGGSVSRGVLLGTMNANRDIRFHYLQFDQEGNLLQGNSRSSTEFLNDGRVVLYENWLWSAGRSGSGNSIVEEIKD
jgi:hypothetical protein